MYLKKQSKKLLLALALLLTLLAAWIIIKPSYPISTHTAANITNPTAVFKKLERQYGIKIVANSGNQSIPEHWRSQPVNGNATPASKIGQKVFASLLPQILAQYPKPLINDHIDTLYLLKTLRFFDTSYGGTAIGNDLFLTWDEEEQDYKPAYITSLFHHELSSLFFANQNFPEQDWKKINPDHFLYLKNDKEILKPISDKRETIISESLYQQGFLNQYATTTLENDFNIYAEFLFGHPEKLKALAKKHRKIRQKLDLIKAYYLKLSTEFTAQLDYI